MINKVKFLFNILLYFLADILFNIYLKKDISAELPIGPATTASAETADPSNDQDKTLTTDAGLVIPDERPLNQVLFRKPFINKSFV